MPRRNGLVPRAGEAADTIRSTRSSIARLDRTGLGEPLAVER